MGTPAFPNLGKHCSVQECRQIDFLPFTCDCCQQVFCLEHRSYIKHKCPKSDSTDVTVVVCPLCAKGVHLVHDQDPNITWESHVNVECDPTNYDTTVKKKKKCPVPRCKEVLTFSNTVKCRDCNIDHCLKHRFGPDHDCPGPTKKDESPFQFMSFLNRTTGKAENTATAAPERSWASTFYRMASSVRSSAEAGMARLSGELNRSQESTSGGQSVTRRDDRVEVCPQCKMRFSNVGDLVDHVERVHERNGVMKSTLDICPKCSKGFRDPVALVEHVEKQHGGVSR
ncbi:hypothetical protein M569_02677, partial [Genlisea aurea]